MVVLYHAEISIRGVDAFSGGFLGVDVFFVISGYLITSIIVREYQSQSFSFANFYERRARRILPAMIFVVLACVPFAWLYLTPDALVEFAGSALSSLFFVANFFFFLQDSYTAEPSRLKPLLHMWSLAVEEQFYLFAPLFLVALIKWKSTYLFLVLLLLALLSLQLAHFGSTVNANAAFFLLPTRAWELLAGSMLAVIELQRKDRHSNLRLQRIAPLIGLFLVLYGMVFFDDQTHHPSLSTLVPIMGVMMIVWYAKPGERITKLLSSGLATFVGKISYSLYLWHWPVFAFARVQLPEISFRLTLVLIGASVTLAVATYYLIEQPFRDTRRMRLMPLAGFLGSGALILIGAQAYFLHSNRANFRFGEYSEILATAQRVDLRKDEVDCHTREIENRCIFNEGAGPPMLVNMGDSHADVLGFALNDLAKHHDLEYHHITQSGCAFVLGAAWPGSHIPETCNRASQDIEIWLTEIPPSVITYTARWKIFDGFLDDDWISPPEGLSVIQALEDTFDYITAFGHRLVIVEPTLETTVDFPREIQRILSGSGSRETKREEIASLVASRAIDASAEDNEHFTQFLREYNRTNPRVEVVSVLAAQCDASTHICPNAQNGHLMFEDLDHLSPYAAQLAVNIMGDAIVSAADQLR